MQDGTDSDASIVLHVVWAMLAKSVPTRAHVHTAAPKPIPGTSYWLVSCATGSVCASSSSSTSTAADVSVSNE